MFDYGSRIDFQHVYVFVLFIFGLGFDWCLLSMLFVFLSFSGFWYVFDKKISCICVFYKIDLFWVLILVCFSGQTSSYLFGLLSNQRI
jgi:hypothetical protein